jgi:hypothetical protein
MIFAFGRSSFAPESGKTLKSQASGNLFLLSSRTEPESRMHFLGACASVFGLGFLYFISAIPAGAGMHLPLWLAALLAWLGYSSGGFLVAFAGEPLREMLIQRLKIQTNPDKPSLVMRAWKRYGLPALGLLAPVTVGPQVAALLALALGAPKLRVALAISLGALPWAITFAVLIAFGVKLVKGD